MKKVLLSILFAFLLKNFFQKNKLIHESAKKHFLRDDIYAGKYDKK